MRTLHRVWGVVALLAVIVSLPLSAQGWIDPIRPLPPNANGRIERLRSAVQVSITGRVARVSVEEWFRNNGPMLEEGMYHFRLPGDAWPFRYLGDRNRLRAPRSFRLEVDSAAQFGDPYSPTHHVQVARRDSRIEVTLGDAANTGDFELLLPLARGLVGLSLLPHHPVGEDGYFMLLLAPGAASEAAALRRDVVAVIDVSGSMSGEKISQAKSALTQLLGSLRDGDRF